MLKKRKVLFTKKLKKFWGILWFGLVSPLIGFAGGSGSEMTSETSEPWTLNMPEVIEDAEGNPVGIKLHLPEGLLKACKDDYWKLDDPEDVRAINAVFPDGINDFCRELLGDFDLGRMKASQRMRVLRKLALIFSLADGRNTALSFDFCKRCDEESCLQRLFDKDKKHCNRGVSSSEDEYLQQFHWCFPRR